jgi:hypothetical protein
MGLREQIKNAGSEAEISDLLKVGKKYEFASDATQRSWKSTAKFRLSQLTKPIPVQTPSENTTTGKSKKKTSKKN